MGEPGRSVPERLCLPVLVALLGRLERRVLADCRVGVGVDLLHVLGADAVGKVSRELLLEAVYWCLIIRIEIKVN
jgi:hypothetical protein